MRIFSKKTLENFSKKHSSSKTPLETWFKTAEKAKWSKPNDVKLDYPSASIIGGSRMVFNISGNNYRLIVKFNYQKQFIFVCFIGTHAQYDKVDAETIKI